MKKLAVFSLILLVFVSVLGFHSAFAVPIAYNQTAISIPWTVQARNSTVTDLFTNNDTHLLNMQFENNLVDNSNYYNNATWSGSSSFVTGKWGSYAANFTGSNSIKINTSVNLGFEYNQPFSISFWGTGIEVGSNEVFLSKGIFGSGTGWSINKDTFGNLFFSLSSNGFTNQLAEFCSPSGLNSNTLHQYVWTYNGNSLTSGFHCYQDGISLTTGNAQNNLSGTILNTSPITLGSDSSGGSKLKGKIDDLHIFNRVLSQSEITADFNTGIYPSKPTLITNWYHYTSTASKIGLKLGTNTQNLVLACTPYQSSLAIQGENILYDCTKSGSTTRQINTDSINTYSNSSSVLFHSNGCQSNDQDFSTFIFPTTTYVHSFCFGGSSSGSANNATATTVSGNNTVYSGLNNPTSPTIANNGVFLSGQKFALSSSYATNTFLRFNSNTTNTNDANISLFTTDLCDLTFMPGYTLRQISTIGCDDSIGANQIHYLNGTQMLQVNNYYSNNTLPFFSSIQDNQYKSALTLLPNILGITPPFTDFILYTPSANYMVVLTGTASSGNIYYVNVNTITSLLAKNYAYQSYMMTTQSTTSSFGIVNTNMGQTVRLYGPSNLNITTNIGGLFTVTSPYQIQAFPSSTSNGQTRIIDPQWTNVPATNYPMIWTATQLLYPIYLTVANAPTDAGLMVTNNNVVINSTQQTWAVLRLDSTHSGEYDVPAGTCQNVYIADISVKPAVYTYEGSTCATGVNQKTITYTNTLPLNFYTFTYGATHTYTPTNNQLTTTVRAGTAPFTYNVVVKNSTGAVAINSTFTSNSTLTSQNFNVSSVTKPASLYISAGGNTIYTAYLGSSLSLSSVASFFHQYFSYDGFDLISFLPLVFASAWTRNTVGIGAVIVVVFIATLSWLSIVVVPDQYIYIMAFISILGMLGYRGLYGG